jgi:predicted amidohydrolase YtcJ
MSLVISDVEVARRRVDVRIAGTTIAEIAPRIERHPDDEVWPAGGGVVLPGLHDHHVHLFAMAAAQRSIDCTDLPDSGALRHELRAAATTQATSDWIRAIGYHEDIAGELDRRSLDDMVSTHPVRVQHRSGGLWMLNTAALRHLQIDSDTGRLWRADARLRADSAPPDLSAVGAELAAYGITGVTDATPDLDSTAYAHIRSAVDSGALPQRVHLLGAPGETSSTGRVTIGPRKILLPDHDLPPLGDIAEAFESAHDAGRAVAVHCVTREALLLTVVALEKVGARSGDRVEHGSVIPDETVATLRELGVAVVTQPGFVAERGDRYLRDVDPADVELLYRYASLRAAGVRVAPSSDAPYADPDPWRTMRAAAARRTPSGAVLTAHECVPARTTLDGYLSRADDPGGAPRTIKPGAAADLVLLHVPLAEALRNPTRDHVALVIANGRVVDS